jgi:hypothetical protein
MKHRSLFLAALALGVAACGNGTPPRKDAAPDAGGVDASVPVDTAAADMQTPDRAPEAGGGPDRADVAPDGGGMMVDGGPRDTGIDVGSDVAPPPDTGRDVSGPDLSPDVSRDVSPDAGPSCGPGASREMLCASYCDGIGRFCTRGDTQYRNADECRAACNGPAWACGNPGDTTGNSLFCRMAHMTLAGLGSPAAACPNAGPNSPVCR